MPTFPKPIYRFIAIPVKIQVGCFFFSEIGNLIPKFIGKCKEKRITKTTLKKNKVGELTLPDFKVYH